MIDYYYLLNDQFHINTRAGLIQQSALIDFRFQAPDSSRLSDSPIPLRTVVRQLWDVKQSAFFATGGAQGILGNATYTGFATIIEYRRNVDSGQADYHDHKQIYVLPRLSAKWELSRQRTISIRYSEQIHEPSLLRLTSIAYVTSPQEIVQGNPSLQPYRQRQLQIRYQRFRTRQSFYIGLILTRTAHPVRYNTQFIGADRIRYPQNILQPIDNIVINGHLFKSSITTSGFVAWNLTYSSDQRLINNVTLPTQSLSADCNFNLAYEGIDPIVLELEGWTALTYQWHSQQVPLITLSVGPTIQWNPEAFPFRLAVHYEIQPVRSFGGSRNITHNLITKLTYEPDNSPWQFVLNGWNLLGQSISEDFNISDIRIFHQRTQLIAPYVIFTVQYKIR